MDLNTEMNTFANKIKQATHCIIEEFMRAETHKEALTNSVISKLDYIFRSGPYKDIKTTQK